MNVGHYIEKWYGTKPKIVTYGGVNTVAIGLSKIPKEIKPNPHILFIGRLAPDIGTKTYLELFKKLQAFSLDVYGDGPLRWKVEKYGKVHGFVPELGRLIKKADIVCASSYLTILQALSYGKPVIAVYENALKKDYLTLAPFAMWITINNSPTELAKIISNSEFSILNKNLRNLLKEYLEQHT
jgi:glycosyltransferase involved in cell wall biosynthesis